MKYGTPLGLCDSDGNEFKVGSIIRRTPEISSDTHGSWVEYRITVQGTTPLMIYNKSEKGDILPKGYTASCLSDLYDLVMFVFTKNSMSLRPEECIRIIKPTKAKIDNTL